jgi:signal transduction histidine kinase/DNA-binding response OmpR family regulator
MATARHDVSVLMVDDLPANLLALEAVLGPLGYTLIRAQSGLEALERARERDFAAILLDVRMRGLDGLETASLIKRSQRNRMTPILFLTADAPPPAVTTAAYAQGAADFLIKPFSPEMLRSKVTVFAELYRAREEVKRQGELLRAREAEAFALLVGDVGKTLISAKSLRDMLQLSCEAVVKHVDAALAQVWTRANGNDDLELRASAGPYPRCDGEPAHVVLGEQEVGMIAERRAPLISNDIHNDLRIADRDWALREGLASFVGYPLLVDGELVGVAALFARRELGADVLEGFASVSDMVALGVSRYRAEEKSKQLYLQQRKRAAQMRSLADASIAINTAGDVHGILRVAADRAALLIEAHQAVATATGGNGEAAPCARHLSERYALWRAGSGLPESTCVCLPLSELDDPVRLTQAELGSDSRFSELEHARAQRVPMRGWLAAPLIGRGGLRLGLIQLSDKIGGAEFSEEDERVLVQLAQVAAVAIENMQLTERMTAIAMDNARLFKDAQALIRALERSNAELDQFAYVASHDLKAPLRGIANLAQWIEEDMEAALGPEAREQLALLKSRVQRMEGLINGILDYSRAGRVAGQPERVDVRRLILDVVELLSPADGSVQIGESMPELFTERVPLEQILMNLIGNALKHARRDDALVRVDVRAAGNAWEFAVKDNGPGIAPEFHDKIWGIFQTLEPRDVVEGTGIGLSIVKKIVESKGGRAWVESEPGAGATFRFTWPGPETDGTP